MYEAGHRQAERDRINSDRVNSDRVNRSPAAGVAASGAVAISVRQAIAEQPAMQRASTHAPHPPRPLRSLSSRPNAGRLAEVQGAAPTDLQQQQAELEAQMVQQQFAYAEACDMGMIAAALWMPSLWMPSLWMPSPAV